MKRLVTLLPLLAAFGLYRGMGSRIEQLKHNLTITEHALDGQLTDNNLLTQALNDAIHREITLFQQLDDQVRQLATLDEQHRSTVHKLQQALATPPAGRPDCAREPLPADAVRLFQRPATDANTGDHSATPGRPDSPLPGA